MFLSILETTGVRQQSASAAWALKCTATDYAISVSIRSREVGEFVGYILARQMAFPRVDVDGQACLASEL
jgi:hypothetical protein